MSIVSEAQCGIWRNKFTKHFCIVVETVIHSETGKKLVIVRDEDGNKVCHPIELFLYRYEFEYELEFYKNN